MQLRENTFYMYEITHLSLLINVFGMMRTKYRFVIQPMPEMFIFWELIFSTGPLIFQTAWRSPLESTDASNVVASDPMFAMHVSLWLHTALHHIGIYKSISRLGQNRERLWCWASKSYSVPFLLTLSFHYKKELFIQMLQLLASTSFRNEFLNICIGFSSSVGDGFTEVKCILFQYP